MNKDFSQISVSKSDSIETALKKLAGNKPKETNLPAGIALVVGGGRLLGIATEGDIRRAISRGVKVGVAVSTIMNRNPFLVEGPRSSTEILSLVVNKIRKEDWHKDRLDKIIIVDGQKRVLDLVSFYDLWQQSDVKYKHVGIVGLGYVGLTLGLTLADLGFKVKGLDKNMEVADRISRGLPHFYEAGLDILLKDHLGKNITVVKNFRRENNCDIYFVCVGTPLDKNKNPDLKYLKDAAKNLGRVLKYGDAVILRSTVPVGTTRRVVLPILEEVSGLKGGEDFSLAFAPERTIEGKALEELRKLPQVIGGLNHKSADMAQSVFGFMTHSNVLVDTLEEAEMVKLVNNTYRDTTFGFANEVSLVAQKWGLSAKKIIEAANYGYERSNVPQPSPGVGGYCLEKDPFIFISSAKAKGYHPKLFSHARRVNESMIDFISRGLEEFARTHKPEIKKLKILVFGLAFKGRPATSDLRGSTSLAIIRKLQALNLGNVYGYDPLVPKREILPLKIKYVSDLSEGIAGADAILVLNNNPHFAELDMRKLLARAGNPVFFFDGWGMFNKDEVTKTKSVHYKCL